MRTSEPALRLRARGTFADRAERLGRLACHADLRSSSHVRNELLSARSCPAGRSRAIAVTIVVAVAAVLASTASGASGLRVDTSSYPAVGVTVVAGRAHRPEPALFENGVAVHLSYARSFGNADAVALVVDRSRSMQGTSFLTARRVAASFLDGASRHERIALFAVSGKAAQLTPFSRRHGPARMAVRSLRVATRPGSALYDGVVLAAEALRRAHARHGLIVLVTDGEESSSRVDITAACAVAAAAHGAIYAVGIKNGHYHPGALDRLARATYGAFFGAARPGASGGYGDVVARIDDTWRLEYATTLDQGERVRLVMRQGGSPQIATRLTLPGSAPRSSSQAGEIAMIVVIAIAALALVVALDQLVRSREARRREQARNTRRRPPRRY